MRFGTERDREENRSVSGRITLFVFPGGKHMRGHFSERKSEWKPSFLMPMSLSTLRASAPLCHLDTCGNVLFACLLHQILSASGAGAESVSVLPPPGLRWCPFQRKGNVCTESVYVAHLRFLPGRKGAPSRDLSLCPRQLAEGPGLAHLWAFALAVLSAWMTASLLQVPF